MARRGRKRKLGKRHPNGRLVQKQNTDEERQADDRRRTSRQPHRRSLRPEDRLDERAESPLGRMLLKGLLRIAGERDDELATLRFDAGVMYAQVVGAYRSTIEAPKAIAGAGRGFDCTPAACGNPNFRKDYGCECERRRARYDRAFESLHSASQYRSVAQRITKIVVRAAVFREEIAPQDFVYLAGGLDALRKHFGLTAKRERAHC